MVTFKDFFSFKNNRFFWLNIIGMIVVIVLLVFGTLEWLNIYTRHGEAVEVPNIKNININQAQLMLKNCELSVVVVDSSYVRGLTPGVILDQNPVEGSKVKKGRAIYVTINSDKVPMVSVPDLIDNSSLRQAEAKLRALGFKVTEPKYISGEKDWVYGLIYNGRELYSGEKIPRESVITVCAGNGSDQMEIDSTGIDSTMNMELSNEAEVDKSWF